MAAGPQPLVSENQAIVVRRATPAGLHALISAATEFQGPEVLVPARNLALPRLVR
jgi:hypothetical protein